MDLTITNHENRQTATATMLRLVLYKGEVYRLPATGRGLRILSGIAWATVTGEDMFLVAGETVTFPSRVDRVLVSALSRSPLVLEVLGDNSLAGLGTLVAARPGWQDAA